MSDSDLDLLETETIVDALERRFKKGVLLVGVQGKTASESATSVFFRCGRTHALGLARYADILIAREIECELDDAS